MFEDSNEPAACCSWHFVVLVKQRSWSDGHGQLELVTRRKAICQDSKRELNRSLRNCRRNGRAGSRCLIGLMSTSSLSTWAVGESFGEMTPQPGDATNTRTPRIGDLKVKYLMWILLGCDVDRASCPTMVRSERCLKINSPCWFRSMIFWKNKLEFNGWSEWGIVPHETKTFYLERKQTFCRAENKAA